MNVSSIDDCHNDQAEEEKKRERNELMKKSDRSGAYLPINYHC